MQESSTKNVLIYYEKKYLKETMITKNNVTKINTTVEQLWGLKKHNFIKIYIIKSNIKFIFLSLPLINKIIYAIILPIWYFKVNKALKYWKAFSFLTDNTPTILLKPMETYKKLDLSIGNMLYKKEKYKNNKFISALCHEIVLVILNKYNLSKWLSQGIAMVTVEKFVDKQTINAETIGLLLKKNKFKEIKGKDYIKPNKIKFVYIYSKGYWTVRYLEENYPGFLKETFKNYSGEDIVEQIILKLGVDLDNYWEQLDELLYDNYKHLLEK